VMMDAKENLLFTDKVGNELKKYLAREKFSRLFLLVDENTEKYCLPVISAFLPVDFHLITITSGEENKTLATCEQIWSNLTEKHADRQALLLNLGGGVICDMGGFCARTYKRGIRFWNIPTTLLSQVDASVGGKLGIDFGGFKNQIGLFSAPDIVFLDSVFFNTLPPDELLSGFAEMVKHALISNREMFDAFRQQDYKSFSWQQWVPKSVAIKREVVAKDPFEKGIRKILNFGHTIGHAIESNYLNTEKSLKHGEAIAIGMITETYLSEKKNRLAESDSKQIIDYLLSVFPQQIIEEASIASIVKLALQDKKNVGNTINAVLLDAIGSTIYDVEISEDEIRQSLYYYNTLLK